MRPAVSVIIPWLLVPEQEDKQDSNWWRPAALAHVRDWWDTTHPDWQIIIGTMEESDGKWCKGLAVHRGLQVAAGKTIVVADADVTCDGMEAAVRCVADQHARWAVPHRVVCRLTEESTIVALQGGGYPPPPARLVAGGPYVRVHPGAVGGGMVVLPRGLLEEVPIDPRFRGWGQEDHSWGRALTMIAGHPWRGSAYMFHLWHESRQRDGTGLTDAQRRSAAIGSAASYQLWKRYECMATLPDMLALVSEARDTLS